MSGKWCFPLVVQPDRPGEPVRLAGRLDILVCSDICVPASFDLALDLPAGDPAIDGRSANLINQFQALVPRDDTISGLTVESVYVDDDRDVLEVDIASITPLGDADVFVEAGDGWAFGPPTFDFGEDGRQVRGGIPNRFRTRRRR